jgi:hypothetical protein
MQYLKVFVKPNCPVCPAAKEVASGFPATEVYDVEEPEGLAEAAFYSVLCTPSIVVVDESGNELYSWRCSVPKSQEVSEQLGSSCLT